MQAWFKVMKGLHRLIDNPDTAWRTALALDEKKMRAQLYDSPETQIRAWHRQIELMREAHVFEFNNDTTMMLMLTDNEPHDVRLPFPVVFLDCEFDLPFKGGSEHFVGVLLADVQFDVVIGGKAITVSGAIPATAYLATGGGGLIEMVHPVGVDVLKALTDAAGKKISASRIARKELNVLSNLTTNFLDLLETPDVMLVPLGRHRMRARREARGKEVPPVSDKVVLQPAIRRYIQTLKEGGLFQYSHRFWVRGHWRHFRSDYFKDKRGEREWIKPFVKGEGILVKKRYVQRSGQTRRQKK